jgi:hypothetical protein
MNKSQKRTVIREPVESAASAHTITGVMLNRYSMIDNRMRRRSNGRLAWPIAEIAMRRAYRQADQHQAQQPGGNAGSDSDRTLHSTIIIPERRRHMRLYTNNVASPGYQTLSPSTRANSVISCTRRELLPSASTKMSSTTPPRASTASPINDR